MQKVSYNIAEVNRGMDIAMKSMDLEKVSLLLRWAWIWIGANGVVDLGDYG